MTVAPPPPKLAKIVPPPLEDPSEFRMSIGDHLEELRWRLILSLIGLGVAVLLCMAVGKQVIVWFCAPLIHGLQAHNLSPTLIFTGLSDPFMLYLKVAFISAALLSGPWMIYQLWLFVAAGLYPAERKMITRYIPVSISLFIGGVVFVYYLVLPLSIDFFIDFGTTLPLPHHAIGAKIATTQPLSKITLLAGDPMNPAQGDLWFNTVESRLKFYYDNDTRSINFGAENLASPQLKIDEFIDMSTTFMLVFGISFQLPLVILALVSVGIVEIAFLRKQRRMVYFILTIVAAVIAPGDIVTSMMSLLIPMVILYELGIGMAVWSERKRAKVAAEV